MWVINIGPWTCVPPWRAGPSLLGAMFLRTAETTTGVVRPHIPTVCRPRPPVRCTTTIVSRVHVPWRRPPPHVAALPPRMVRQLLQVRTPISRRLKARSEEEDKQITTAFSHKKTPLLLYKTGRLVRHITEELDTYQAHLIFGIVTA